MTLDKFLTGIEILKCYYAEPNGYKLAAEHDIIYLFATERPMIVEDVMAMYELGWFQPEVSNDGDDPELYNPEEGWAAYV